MARRKRLKRRVRKVSVARRKAGAGAGAREITGVKRSVDKLVRTLTSLHADSDAALADIAGFRALVEADDEHRLVAAAMNDNLFRDLALLDQALSAAEISEVELRRLRAVPAAVLRWASTLLQVEAYLTAGEEREIPSAAAGKYEWTSPPDARKGDLVKLRVMAPGWKWRHQILGRPLVEQMP